MKLSSRDARAYLRKPDPDAAGVLIFGSDAMRVALKRQEVILALIGPTGADEMRLDRMSGADLRKEPARLQDAMKAQGFFPGARVAFVDEATDGLAPVFEAALADWVPGDAQVVATAGSLNTRSALRAVFEKHPKAYAAGIYDDPPSREEIEAMLREAGLGAVGGDAARDLDALARALDPGDFRQTVERIALYKHGDDTPLSAAEVALLAPQSMEADVDDILDVVAEARTQEIGPVMARLRAQGVTPVTICIGATRHFRALHMAASDPGGPSKGLSRMRPPIFGPRRDKLERQARRWGMAKLEQALGLLIDTDLTLRSSSRAPAMAVMERTLIRLAMLGRT